MDDGIAMLKQLRKFPDDGLRLAYADWLEEYAGFDGFGEFVAKSIATPTLELMAENSPLKSDGERICELFATHSAKWFGIEGLSIKGVDTSNNWIVNMEVQALDKNKSEKIDAAINIARGYVTKVSMYWRQYQQYGIRLARYYPVVDAVLRDFSPINTANGIRTYGLHADVSWYMEDELQEYDKSSKLPKVLFDRLKGGVWERHSPLSAAGIITTRVALTYPSAIAAKIALSASALQYAHELANTL